MPEAVVIDRQRTTDVDAVAVRNVDARHPRSSGPKPQRHPRCNNPQSGCPGDFQVVGGEVVRARRDCEDGIAAMDGGIELRLQLGGRWHRQGSPANWEQQQNGGAGDHETAAEIAHRELGCGRWKRGFSAPWIRERRGKEGRGNGGFREISILEVPMISISDSVF